MKSGTVARGEEQTDRPWVHRLASAQCQGMQWLAGHFFLYEGSSVDRWSLGYLGYGVGSLGEAAGLMLGLASHALSPSNFDQTRYGLCARLP